MWGIPVPFFHILMKVHVEICYSSFSDSTEISHSYNITHQSLFLLFTILQIKENDITIWQSALEFSKSFSYKIY